MCVQNTDRTMSGNLGLKGCEYAEHTFTDINGNNVHEFVQCNNKLHVAWLSL